MEYFSVRCVVVLLLQKAKLKHFGKIQFSSVELDVRIKSLSYIRYMSQLA